MYKIVFNLQKTYKLNNIRKKHYKNIYYVYNGTT
jgi:hypothetical protein